MPRIRVGRDKVHFRERDRVFAQEVAEAIPALRWQGRQLLGLSAGPVRVVIRADPLQPWECLRASRRSWCVLAGLALLTVAALTGRLRANAGTLIGLSLSLVVGLAELYFKARGRWARVLGVAAPATFFAPTIALKAPSTPVRAADTVSCLEGDWKADFICVAAHEFAHVLLYAHFRGRRIPDWVSECLAAWFAERATGQSWWPPHTQQYLTEPEPKGGFASVEDREVSHRLAARYYWEVRALAERGLLPRLLATPAKQLSSLRPQAGPLPPSSSGP